MPDLALQEAMGLVEREGEQFVGIVTEAEKLGFKGRKGC
jgi:hypothetical protein